MDYATFELAPAERKDIPKMIQICFAASLSTTDFRLWYPKVIEFQNEMTQMLEDHIGDSTWQHLKVVEKRRGVLAAWASWNTPTDAQIRERDGKAAAKIADAAKGKGKVESEKWPKFVHYVQGDIERWFEQSTSGKRHMICKMLFTDPSFQRQGMGNALVEYGNQLADQASLPIFLQASPDAYPLYAKHGFETVQYLDVDLREWMPGGKSNDKGYGNYRYRHMLRLPQTLPKIS